MNKQETNSGFWMDMMTLRNFVDSSLNHLHEKFGQSIAYACSNSVTPSWSVKKKPIYRIT